MIRTDGAGAYRALLDEVAQRHRARQPALAALEGLLGRRVVTYFVSFSDAAAMIEDADADILEEVLRHGPAPAPGELPRGVSLVLNAPGGDGLAAERVVRVCRSYSGGDFEVIVPRMAKSAATMICLGSNAVWMSENSELGPIDPQVSWMDGGRAVRLSARELIDSYEDLLQQAERCVGHLEPYLQQLARYDARLIEGYRTALALSESIAVNLLRCGMLRDRDEDEIRERIRPFLEGRETRSHRRAIYPDRAEACGLRVRLFDLHGEPWQRLWELYLRSSYAVDQGRGGKLIETVEQSFTVGSVGEPATG